MTQLPAPHRLLAGGTVALGLAVAGCSTEPATPDVCNVPLVEVTPTQASLFVGDTVLAQAALIGPPECRPINMTLRAMRWMSDDSTIARVSAVKGYVVAKGPGEAIIRLYFPADSSNWGEVHITVNAALATRPPTP